MSIRPAAYSPRSRFVRETGLLGKKKTAVILREMLPHLHLTPESAVLTVEDKELLVQGLCKKVRESTTGKGKTVGTVLADFRTQAERLSERSAAQKPKCDLIFAFIDELQTGIDLKSAAGCRGLAGEGVLRTVYGEMLADSDMGLGGGTHAVDHHPDVDELGGDEPEVPEAIEAPELREEPAECLTVADITACMTGQYERAVEVLPRHIIERQRVYASVVDDLLVQFKQEAADRVASLPDLTPEQRTGMILRAFNQAEYQLKYSIFQLNELGDGQRFSEYGADTNAIAKRISKAVGGIDKAGPALIVGALTTLESIVSAETAHTIDFGAGLKSKAAIATRITRLVGGRRVFDDVDIPDFDFRFMRGGEVKAVNLTVAAYGGTPLLSSYETTSPHNISQVSLRVGLSSVGPDGAGGIDESHKFYRSGTIHAWGVNPSHISSMTKVEQRQFLTDVRESIAYLTPRLGAARLAQFFGEAGVMDLADVDTAVEAGTLSGDLLTRFSRFAQSLYSLNRGVEKLEALAVDRAIGRLQTDASGRPILRHYRLGLVTKAVKKEAAMLQEEMRIWRFLNAEPLTVDVGGVMREIQPKVRYGNRTIALAGTARGKGYALNGEALEGITEDTEAAMSVLKIQVQGLSAEKGRCAINRTDFSAESEARLRMLEAKLQQFEMCLEQLQLSFASGGHDGIYPTRRPIELLGTLVSLYSDSALDGMLDEFKPSLEDHCKSGMDRTELALVYFVTNMLEQLSVDDIVTSTDRTDQYKALASLLKFSGPFLDVQRLSRIVGGAKGTFDDSGMELGVNTPRGYRVKRSLLDASSLAKS